MRRRPLGIVIVSIVVVLGVLFAIPATRARLLHLGVLISGRKTIEGRLAEFGEAIEARMARDFAARGLAYPPGRLVLVVFKDSKVMELYAAAKDSAPRLVCPYGILAASGTRGPKLCEGDGQVPEGIYAVESLNPNSLYDVSLRLDYPNAADREQALRDGRMDLGGDIMIHGGSASIGCLAMGDPVAEELFTLAARVGIENIQVIIAPTDFRAGFPFPNDQPAWVLERYRLIAEALPKL